MFLSPAALAAGVLVCALIVPRPAAARVDFSREILPVLSDNCFYCHGPDADHRKAKLRLDDEADAKRDRDGDKVIFPGNSAKSLLVERITTENLDDKMPPVDSHKKLTAQQIVKLKQWIDEGAAWGEHWAFERITRPVVPKISDKTLKVRNAIDAFILERLAREKLKPSPEADKITLIRRVTLDLTGLPPTPRDVDAFLLDKSPEAYEKVVDRLLASPAFGERMAWEWMEVSRYADSNGFQGDNERTMWPWRDWVVKAFNSNMAYDRFTILQLAGDMLPNAGAEEKLPTGFCRNHPINGEGGRIAEENRVDYVMDMAETTGTTWLGLTFNCTRCHDHKFDPLTKRDYYGLFAFFNQTAVDGGGGDPQTAPVLEMAGPEDLKALRDAEKNITVAIEKIVAAEKELFPHAEKKKPSDSPAAEMLPDEVRRALAKQPQKRDPDEMEILIREMKKSAPEYTKALGNLQQVRKTRSRIASKVPRVMVMEDMKKPRKTLMLEKGQYNKTGEEVTASTPAKLPALPANAPLNRLSLAQWLVSAENPLTARVTVNRYWQTFFGTGLVKTSEDFGRQGQPPSHPELLDWLASEFRDTGWDVKKFVRLMVTSQTYRQSSRSTPELRERDPDNRLLARAPRFRMPSWMLRDQALAVSGLMVDKIGGPPVKPYQPDGVWEEVTFGNKKYKQDSGEDLYRRSLYVFWRRIIGPTEFFDTSSRMVCNVKPTRNNSPLHALTTLNDTTYVEAARKLAERVMLNAKTPAQRVDLAFRFVLARKCTPAESKALLQQLDEGKKLFAAEPAEVKSLLAVGESKNDPRLDATEHAAWTAVCLAVLNLDETLTKE